MLGHTLYLELKKTFEVLGVCRSQKWHPDLVSGIDTNDLGKVSEVVQKFKPDFILNAVGVIKQLDISKNKLHSIEINSLWPHKLCEIASEVGAKVVHFSTDCVFTGQKGDYTEADLTDARDTYGLTKLMGEVDYAHSLTLRTSIIGHELRSNVSLIDWFLSQQNECSGFQKAIYSGFPTITIARFLKKYVFENWFSGMYHFSSEPINKFELLNLVAKQYDKQIKINPNTEFKIDRSLNSDKLRKLTGYVPPTWPELVAEMHGFYIENKELYKDKK